MSAAIDRVVRDRLGLDPSTLGPNVLGRAVELRKAARGMTDPALYAARLMTEPAERDALAAELVVPETWFHRGGHALFDRLTAFVVSRASRGVRVLSAPCSTGEEPYSLAMAFFDHLTAPASSVIDAVDLSERNLARAAAARYSTSAFREPGPDPRPPYFRKTGDAWEVLPHLRQLIRFQPGNLTDPLFLTGERPYDLILCRNVFIYFTPEAKVRAMANLDRLLALDGRLCVTPAEADRLPPGRFVPDGPSEFGIYKRAGVDSKLHAALLAEPSETRAEPPPPREPVAATPTPTPGTLAAARHLADSGNLTDARAACERILRGGPNADALALLGVIHLAAGNANAAYDAFGKALYLAPDHLEAVSHMIGLCERRGNPARAAALRKRLAKLTPAEDA